MGFSNETISALIILLVACVLFGCSAFMRFRTEGFEDFQVGIPEGTCGVDLAPCPFGTRCINGFCRTEDTIPISPSSGLPVKPEGYIRL
jgi:hypothetical protein